MKDSNGRPVVALSVPLIRKDEKPTSIKMSVTFEAEADLLDFTDTCDNDLIEEYVRACLLQHIYSSYWGLRDK